MEANPLVGEVSRRCSLQQRGYGEGPMPPQDETAAVGLVKGRHDCQLTVVFHREFIDEFTPAPDRQRVAALIHEGPWYRPVDRLDALGPRRLAGFEVEHVRTPTPF